MAPRKDNRWTFKEYKLNGSGTGLCVLHKGKQVIGLHKDRSDADQICRVRAESRRAAYDAKRHLIRLQILNEENRLLVSALKRVADALRGTRPSELSAARQEVGKALKRIRGGRGGAS